MNKIITYTFDEYRNLANARLFKNLLYTFLIYRVICWTMNFDILFGANSMSAIFVAPVSFFHKAAFLIYRDNVEGISVILLILLGSLSLIGLLLRKSYIVIDIIIYFILVNIHTRIYTSLTAGDPLTVNLVALSAFLSKSKRTNRSNLDIIRIALHNFSFIALMVQMCIVYFYSALAKWFDPDWFSGMAIHYVNQTRHYSRPFLGKHAPELFYLSFILNYVVLFYQSLFPILVWFKKHKNAFLWIGIIMHLYIAFVMGLYSFGFIMTISYSLFYKLKTEH